MNIIYRHIAICLLVAGQLAAQTDAAAYFVLIDSRLKQVQQANRDYVRAVTRSKPSKVEKYRQAYLRQTKEASSAILELPPWRGSASLRDTALAYLRNSMALITEDYGHVANIESIAEYSFDAMEAFIAARRLVQRQLENSAASLENEYRVFATNNQLGLKPETTLTAEMRSDSAALYYYERIYQVFFSNYKQEAYLLGAIEQGNVSGIGQNREALARSAAEGLRELESMHEFGDSQLRANCRKLLNFYSNEANVTLADAALYFVRKDDLEKSAEAVRNLRGDTSSVHALVRYQETKEEFETETESFERTLHALSRKRHSLQSSWQKAADHFLRRNVR